MNTTCFLVLVIVFAAVKWPSEVGAAAIRPDVRVVPNRVAPRVLPPQTGPSFSADPTSEEISQAGIFDERLVPLGGEPRTGENAALAAALLGYAKGRALEDFSSLTGFLASHPNSPWRAALLTGLGLEYYNSGYYSRALEVWQEAWVIGQRASDAEGKLLMDRTICELAGLYSRLGRMIELEVLLKSVESRPFLGGSTERMVIAREVLEAMKSKPEVCFRCGPLALQTILRSLNPQAPVEMEIFNSRSTHQGFSLPQVSELSGKVGLNYQMAFRSGGDFIVPSVVHWRAGHYAAMVRREGDRYVLVDPTFGTTVWATRQALESESSGYFLVPSGELAGGWRGVDRAEGSKVWGKGTPALSDRDIYCRNDHQTGSCSMDSQGMPVSSVHLMLANLQIRDTPVGYTPPVGPPVRFTLRYNQRDYLQAPSEIQRILGPKWTHDWNESLQPVGADMKYIVGGGGARTFTSFNPATQSYAPNLYDQTLLHKIGPDEFEMTWPDGSKRFFGPLRKSSGLLLSSVMDSAGNEVTLTYDQRLRLVALTDAIGQVTTIFYENATKPDLITKVTDPFGRSAVFQYQSYGFPVGGVNSSCTNVPLYLDLDFLVGVTDVLGLKSTFRYDVVGSAPTNHLCEANVDVTLVNEVITGMTTPYGDTTFRMGGGTNANHTLFRFVETRHPDGSGDRVEYNQADDIGIPSEESVAVVPLGMATFNRILYGRNTYYWSRTAEASSRGDHTRARIYHWMHAPDLTTTSGVLESFKDPLENRVWFNYPGGGVVFPGTSIRPEKIGRVLDDGQTQLHGMEYNTFGHMTRSVDPLGRRFNLVYATNGLDLVEIRQTRAANDELLFRATYNTQHRPLTIVNAAGRTNSFTYNSRGQVLTATDARGGGTTYTYTADGYLSAIDGPLPGTSDMVKATYDVLGRTRTVTDTSGYRLTFDYDEMDRVVGIMHPDGTQERYTYDRLNLAMIEDRAGRQTRFEYDSMRQLRKKTDALGRVTRFDWCRCGGIRSLTDPMGQTTTWLTDIQGRKTGKRYADGSQVEYQYERTTSRLKFMVDERQQVSQFRWNLDNTIQSLSYANAGVPTPGVSFLYDPDYVRVVSMKDAAGTTRFQYHAIQDPPNLGAGALASVDGPLPHDTITYAYDELNRLVYRAIDGVGVAISLDELGRGSHIANALGEFSLGYDGGSARILSKLLPNGQKEERRYGDLKVDRSLEGLTHRLGDGLISEFQYTHDVARGVITSWSQQIERQSPSRLAIGYDRVNQLVSTSVSVGERTVKEFAYAYDPSGNRETEEVDGAKQVATYNGLNELGTLTAPVVGRTNEWDAANRLVAVTVGNQRTEFQYDGMGRRVGIRQRLNGVEVSHRRFVWSGTELCEERDTTGLMVIKRFFPQGMVIENGPLAGMYYYTRDHLGSIRELTDAKGVVRARYAYDPYGRRTKLEGDVESDFGFAGMFWSEETRLSLTHFRAYDAELGRWLSRDPLPDAERVLGPNLYLYANNDPVNQVDRLGASPYYPWEPGGAPPSPIRAPTPPPAPNPTPAVPTIPPAPSPPVTPSAPPKPPPFEIVYNGPDKPLEIIEFKNNGPSSELPCQRQVQPGTSTRISNGVAAALLIGYTIGTEINSKYNISGRASDMGIHFARWAEDQGLPESDAGVLGALVTLGAATPGPLTLLGMHLLSDD